MKKLTSIILVLSLLVLFSGCGNTKIIENHEYDTYGILNKEEKQNPNVKYKLVTGNVVWSIILFETVIAPIYFIGFSLYEPVGKSDKKKSKGTI